MSIEISQDVIDYIAEAMERENAVRKRKERLLPRSIIGPDTGRSLCDQWTEIREKPLAEGGFIPQFWQEELLKQLAEGRLTTAEARRSMRLPAIGDGRPARPAAPSEGA